MKLTNLSILIPIFVYIGCSEERTSKSNIIGGEEVDPGQDDARRWATVALTTALPMGEEGIPLIEQGHSFCSGTLIGKRLVVTAAHCLQKKDPVTGEKIDEMTLPNIADYIVYFGTQVSPNSGKAILAEEVIPHPEWNPHRSPPTSNGGPGNDIGLILLSEDALEEPVEITSLDDISGEKLFLSGFGVDLRRSENNTGILRQLVLENSVVNEEKNTIETGILFKGVCGGDSGGPMYIKELDVYKLVGTAILGSDTPTMCFGLNSIFTDVRYYTDWFDSFR